jgi:imidazolonepropionase-like amidohydrolase
MSNSNRCRLLLTKALLGWEDCSLEPGACILIEGGRIAAVGSRSELSAVIGTEPCETVDLSELYVVPGLINTHVHLEFSGGENPLADYYAECAEKRLIRAVRNAQVMLRSGVTTVRDCGCSWTALALAEPAVWRLAGTPRLVMCGPPLTVTAGHLHWMDGEADTAEEMVKEVRLLKKRGATSIKIMATGGQMTPGSGPETEAYTTAQMAAAVEESRRSRLPTVAHCLTAEGMVRAIEAGVESIEHCAFFKREGRGWLERVYEPRAAEPFRERKPLFMMGASAHSHRLDDVRGGPHGPLRAASAQEAFWLEQEGRMFDIFSRLVGCGFRPVVGSDAGVTVTPFDETWLELVMMQRAGLSGREVLQAATVHSAAALGLQESVGQIRPGYAADLIGVRENPLEDLGALADVAWIMRDGQIVEERR